MRSDVFQMSPELDALRPKVMAQTATKEESTRYHELSNQRVADILSTPADEIFEVKETQQAVPKKAKIFDNIICSICGESVGIARCVEVGGQEVCQLCAQNQK